MSRRIKILTLIYCFALAVIILIADLYGTNFFYFIKLVPYGDKIGHFLLMGMFSFSVNLTLQAKMVRLWLFNYLMGSLIVFSLVTLEEFSQIFVRGRSFDLFDLAFDYAGIFIFGELAGYFCRKRINHSSARPKDLQEY